MNTKQIKSTITITATVPVTKGDGPGRPSHLTKGEVLDTLRNALTAELVKFFTAAGCPASEIPGRLVRIRVEEAPVTSEMEQATATLVVPESSPAAETATTQPKRRPGRPRKNPLPVETPKA